MANNLTEAITKAKNNNKKISAYNGLAQSLIIDKKNKQIKEKNRGIKVKSADIIAAADNEIVSNITFVPTGTDKLLNAISNLTGKTARVTKLTTNNNQEDYIDIEESGSETSTFADSDPDKPETVTDNLAYLYPKRTATQRSTFNISSLYSDTPTINIADNTYTYKRDSKTITDDDISDITEEGIIITKEHPGGLPSYRLIPNDNLIQTTKHDSYNFMNSFKYQDTTFGQDLFHHNSVSDSSYNHRINKYRYQYGLNDIFIGRKKAADSGAFISPFIYIGSCSYISLISNIYPGVEFSIIDGKEEIPILLEDQDIIEEEKLFFGLMPRFSLLETTSFTVKKDGVVTSISDIKNLELFLNSKTIVDGRSTYDNLSNYTITYKPVLTAQQYIPKNKEIQVKIIIRKQEPIPVITKCIIRKHGIGNIWPLSSRDESIYYNPHDDTEYDINIFRVY